MSILHEPTSEWREPLPQDCPPTDSTECNGHEVYRCVAVDVSEEDFHSVVVLSPDKRRRDEQMCKSRALSVFLDLADAGKVLTLKAHEGKVVRKMILVHGSGNIKHTPTNNNSHHSWWVCDDVEVLTLVAPDES